MDEFYWSSMTFPTIDWSCFWSQPVTAYIGPGAGLSAMGALLAIVVGIVVAVFGFVWYPTKRLMRKLRPAEPADDQKERGKV